MIRKSQQEIGVELEDKINPKQNKGKIVIPDRMILTQAFVMTFLA